MKQNSIFALVLGAIFVLTISSMDMAFADYDKYSDDDRDDDDDDDKWEKENKS
ncbi:hypothetical protein [Nitrosopumilus sp.]|uniref:hypothetical protein n=1 Tax=Nitrosopumilus sp. TaxID=2024843 RepID=UPI00292FA7D6|nr:hypothetical protein [Nitrosopumilus sp.]